MSESRIRIAVALALAVAAGAPLSAVAQQDEQTVGALEEVLVTAQKREESVQDVPITINTVSGNQIEEMGYTRLEQVTAKIPAVTVAPSPLGNLLYIRGIGSSVNQGFEQSVSMFNDGLYMGRQQLARAPLMDVERVEVLKGPQSIYFGKNTIGGAVSVINAKPTDEFEARVSALYGWTDNEQEYLGVLSGPIVGGLTGRLAVRKFDSDGYLENTLTNEDNPGMDDTSVRGTLAWDATDDLRFVLKYEQHDFNRTGSISQLSVVNPLTAGARATSALNQALAGGPEKYDDERAVINDGGKKLAALNPAFAGVPGFPSLAEKSDNTMDNGYLAVEWQVGEHTLTSITGYASYDYDEVCDCDFSALPLISINGLEDYEQWSQEIRLTSPLGNTLEYIAGAYWQSSDLHYESYEAFGTRLLAAGTPNVSRDYSLEQDQDIGSVFGSLTWNVTDDLRLTGGVRYSQDDKTGHHVLNKRFTGGWKFALPAALCPTAEACTYGDSYAEYDRFERTLPAVAAQINTGVFQNALGTFEHDVSGKRSESNTSWLASAQYDFADEVMGYATISTGFKGGGFDGRFVGPNTSQNFEYGPEEAINYEIGLKSTLFGGTMLFNIDAFYTQVDDYQASVFDGRTAYIVTNAGGVTSKGVEVEWRYRVLDGLTIGASAAYVDAQFDDFENGPCTVNESLAAQAAAIAAGVAGGIPNACNNPADPLAAGKDISGQPPLFAPDWAMNLNAEYRHPIGDNLEVSGLVTVYYSSEYYLAVDYDEVAVQPSYATMDLRLGLGEEGGRWEVAFIGKNLTNEYVSVTTNDQPLVPGNYLAMPLQLRAYAVQATVSF